VFSLQEHCSMTPEIIARGCQLLSQAMRPPALLAKGTILVDANHLPEDTYLLQSGWAMRVQLLADGRRTIIDLYLPGELIGWESVLGKSSLGAVVALTPVICRSIPRRLLTEVLLQREVCLLLLSASSMQQARVDTLAVVLARGMAEERLATFLLNLNARLEKRQSASGGVFRLPMTQQDVSDHLGLTVVHVNRVLRRLRESNLASLSNCKAVIDVEGLSKLAACFQSTAVERIFPWIPDERSAYGNFFAA
jgi:CRP/FNR family transcriptional regulator